jgi:hypothetical protein
MARTVQMRLHLGDDRRGPVRRHYQSILDRGQCRPIEGNVQYRAPHGDHPTIHCLCLFHFFFR